MKVVGGALTSRPGFYDVLEKNEAGGLTTYLLKKADELTNSALIQAIATEVEVRSFSERLPSMQEIFINTVGEAAPTE